MASPSSAASLWLPFNGNFVDLGLAAASPHAIISTNVQGRVFNGAFVFDIANATCGSESLDFPGDGSDVQVVNAGDLDFNNGNPFTVCAWVKTLTGGTVWAYAGTNIMAGQTGTHSIACYVGAGSLSDGEPLGTVVVDRFWEGNDHSTKTVNDGNWHQVAITCDTNGVIGIYIDGTEDAITHQFGYGSANEGANNDAGTWHFTVGATLNNVFPAETGIGNPFSGELDEVAAWPSVLSPTGIYNLYAYGVDNPPPSPLLSAAIVGSQIAFAWTGFGWKLQENTNLFNPNGWTFVSSNNVSPTSMSPQGRDAFFRLIQ